MEENLQSRPKFTSALDPKTRTLVLTARHSLYYKKEIIGGTRLGMPVFCIEITALCPELLQGTTLPQSAASASSSKKKKQAEKNAASNNNNNNNKNSKNAGGCTINNQQQQIPI